MKPTIEEYLLQGTVDWIIVKAESRYIDELEITGENGQKITLQTDGELESKKYRTFGTVAVIPKKLTPDRVLFAIDNKPVRLNEIQPDTVPGDKIYFSYLALNDQSEIEKDHYAISYADAICRVHQGELRTLGSHVLIEPVYPEDAVNVDGIMCRVNSLNMVVEMNIPPIPFQGVIRHLGLPLKSFDYGLEVGQRVVIEKSAWGVRLQGKWQMANNYCIEGTNYLVCREKDIAARVYEPELN